MNLSLLAYRAAKSALYRTGAYHAFLPVAKFDMSIAQLHVITTELARCRDVQGHVVEIGVGGGATSIVMNHFMMNNGISKSFFAIDTFGGFLPQDVAAEIRRGKSAKSYSGYRTNREDWYLKTLRANGVTKAAAFKSSIQDFDLGKVAPIAFCLLDVDLYLPTRDGLPRVYDVLSPGGTIIVDDCDPTVSIFDGAGQAYREFCEMRGMKPEVTETKLGVIRKKAG